MSHERMFPAVFLLLFVCLIISFMNFGHSMAPLEIIHMVVVVCDSPDFEFGRSSSSVAKTTDCASQSCLCDERQVLIISVRVRVCHL